MIASLSPARRRLVLALVVVVVAAAAALAVLAFTARHDPASVPQDRPGPVLLVPGYGGSTTALSSLAARLRAEGRRATIVILPDGGVGDLARQAKTLDAAVRADLNSTGAASVEVIGYSAGGVVARLWARSDGGAAEARRIVTLGSPHHGTDVAAVGEVVPGACPAACQELAPDSDLLNRLNAGDETPTGPQWVSIWTRVDQVVVPPDSARLAGAHNIEVQDVCQGSRVAHGQLPTDPAVQGMVLAELGTGPVRDFSSSDCARLSS
jgi:triacylglycerol esterase/lipase EstA (alpha/beta hydrolase family)